MLPDMPIGCWLPDMFERRRARRRERRPRPRKRRLAALLEMLEPRRLLTAELSYPEDPGDAAVTDLTLVAEAGGSDPFLRLYQTGTAHAVASVQLDDPDDVNVRIRRAAGADDFGDTLRIDLNTFGRLNAFVSGHGGVLDVDFDGGAEGPLGADDHLRAEGGGTYTIGFGLTVQASCDAVIDAGMPVFGGNLTVASEDSVAVRGSRLEASSITFLARAVVLDAGSVLQTAGDISLSAADMLGTVAVPNAWPFPNLSATVQLTSASLSGRNITLSASATLYSRVANIVPLPVAVFAPTLYAEVAVDGSASITATGSVTAGAASTINSEILATAIPGLAVAEIGVAIPVIASTARSHLSGSTTASAAGAVTLNATTTTNVTTTATGVAGVSAVGTTVALPTITTTTAAYIDGSASVLQSASIDVTATANSTVITTANSTPAGAVLNPPTLAAIQAATSAGPQTDAAAIAATFLTANTRAYIATSASLTSLGAVTVTAVSGHNVATTANATPTVGVSNNGAGVAANRVQVTDEAYVGGSPTITAPSLRIRTGTVGGGGTLSAVARSGAAGFNEANTGIIAGALAFSANTLLSEASLRPGTNLQLPSGNTDVEIDARYAVATDNSAEPDGAAVIGGTLGVGRSVATDLSAHTIRAVLGAGSGISGARDLHVTANGNHTTRTTAMAGALAGAEALSLSVAGTLGNHQTTARIDSGTTLALGGALTVQAVQ